MTNRHTNPRIQKSRPTVHQRSPDVSRRRSRSPHSHRHKHKKHDRVLPSPTVPRYLPFGAQQLRKQDYKTNEPIFASYLDVQKEIVLGDLDEVEARGRWKSFVGKWNRGELAEGWYDPSTFQKAISKSLFPRPSINSERRPSPDYGERILSDPSKNTSGSDDDGPGPSLPEASLSRAARTGPSIPSMHDLMLRKELNEEDAEAARLALRHERRANRVLEKERLDELQPRAEAGTKERRMEKKKELASSNRVFAAAKEGDGVEDVPETELLGGEDDGIEGYKKQKKDMERKKNEREIRREEVMHVRREEREIRARDFREREEKTMQGLVELARRRFG